MKIFIWVGQTEHTGYEAQRGIRLIVAAEDYPAALRQVDKILDQPGIKNGDLLRLALKKSNPQVWQVPFALLDMSGSGKTLSVVAAGEEGVK